MLSPNGFTGRIHEEVESYPQLAWPTMEVNWNTVMSGDVTAGSFNTWIVVLRDQSALRIRTNTWLFQNSNYPELELRFSSEA